VATRLVQLLLPVADNEGRAFAPEVYADLRRTLVERFGGATAYVRSPAEGLWAPRAGEVNRDRIVLVEVMDTDYDPARRTPAAGRPARPYLGYTNVSSGRRRPPRSARS